MKKAPFADPMQSFSAQKSTKGAGGYQAPNRVKPMLAMLLRDAGATMVITSPATKEVEVQETKEAVVPLEANLNVPKVVPFFLTTKSVWTLGADPAEPL